MNNTLKLSLIMITLCLNGIAQEKSEVMLLGVYHFDNPGMDTHNMQVDDYFSERRQEEIQAVVAKLATFNPTKILVEFTPNNQPDLDSLFSLYQNDHLQLKDISRGRNEVYQLGFRLARELKIAAPIAIDYSGFWLGDYVDFIADTLNYTKYQKHAKEQSKEVSQRAEAFQKNTIMENLMSTNDWQSIQANHDYYNNVAIDIRDEKGIMFNYQEQQTEIDKLPYFMRSFDFNNIGIEMIAEWYKRNLFIYRNILDQAQNDDRILVIYGSGHVRYLHQLFSDNPDFKLIHPKTYLYQKP